VLVLMVALPFGLAALGAYAWANRIAMLDDGFQADTQKLQRVRRLVASLPALRDALAEEQSNDSFKAYYFDAETPAIAGARLQSQVQDMVRSAGARPVSAQILPTDAADDPPRVQVRIQLQGTTEQLFDVIYRVESARPFLLIDQMSIRSQARNTRAATRRRPQLQPQDNTEDQLTVRLDIFGYFLGGAG
jgi:general secretion pathway protein M